MANTAQLGSYGDVSGSPLVFRNKLINGAMLIDQRNAGASKTPVDGEYLLDRWKAGASAASKFSVQQVTSTAPVGFSHALQITSLSAYSVTTNDNFEIFQLIEGFNTYDLAFGTANAKTITVSFWVRSSLTGTFGGAIQNSAFNRSYPFTYTISATNTWEYKTVTIPGDTSGTWIGATSGAGLVLCLGIGAGTGRSGPAGAWAGATYYNATGATSLVGTNAATLLFSGVQLEAGSVATPFEQRPLGTELVLCQRYYERAWPLGVATGAGTPSYYVSGMVLASATNLARGPAPWKIEKKGSVTTKVWAFSGDADKISVMGSGMTLAGTVVSKAVDNNTFFLLSDSGSGLAIGTWYCYAWTCESEL
jgi:hypothetical protein